MRSTLTLEDDIAERLKQEAFKRGESFKKVVNETLRRGLKRQRRPKAKPYRLTPSSMGAPFPGFNLEKALRLADQLEDLEIVEELRRRK